jgi:hypothetical protein
MSSIFLKLSAPSQVALIAAHDRLPPELAQKIDKPLSYRMLNHRNPVETFSDVRFTATVGELLDLGVDPNELAGSPDNHFVPLACLKEDANGLEITELLISRGANPNHLSANRGGVLFTSPMHDCSDQPVILQKLIDHGGDVSLRAQNGWSVLDHWRLLLNTPSGKLVQARGLRGLDVLVANGLDLRQSMNDGSSFLASCWGSGFLRPRIPSFIALGFDPYQRGTSKGSSGYSLFEHLERKVKAGRGGELARRMLAQINNQTLDAATPTVARQGKGLRL